MHESPLPLTAGQVGMWLAQQVDSSNPMYSIAECVEIRGRFAPALFDEALQRLVDEVDALRVRFVAGDGTARQVVEPVAKCPIRHADFGDAADPAGAAERWMIAALSEPVDLTTGPLFTFALLRLADDEHRWFIKLHHSIADGYSSALFTARVAEIYSALVAERPCPPSPFGPLTELVAADVAYRESADFTQDRSYWLEHCAGLAEPARLAGRPTRVPPGHLRRNGTLPATDTEGLRRTGRECGVSWPIVTIAGIAAYLHLMTGREDIVLGFAVTGRTGQVGRTTPGMMSNAVPLVLTVRPDMSLAELFGQVSAEVRQATRHQRYRAEDLHRELRLVGDRKRLWGPEVNLMLYGEDPVFGEATGKVRGFSAGPEEDLTLVVDGRSGTDISLELHANHDLYTGADLARHHERLTGLLRGIGHADPDRPVALLDVAAPGEREQLAARAASRREYRRGTLADIELDTSTDVPALMWRGTAVSRAELDRDANRLARLLVDRGAGPGDVVAVVGTASPDQVLALLAVQRAGAAFLLVNPAGDAERNAALLAAAAPGIAIVTGSGLVPDLPDGTRIVDMADPWAHYDPTPVTDADRLAPLSAASPAYLDYRPDDAGRLVVVSHATALARLDLLSLRCRIDPRDRVLYRVPGDWAPSAWEPMLALTCGATSVIADPALRSDPAYLADLIADDGVTVAHVGAPLLARVLAAGAAGVLRQVVLGDDPLPEDLRDRFDVPPAAPPWTAESLAEGAYVLDAAMRPVPPAVPGRLYLTEALAPDAVLGDPARTATTVVADPCGRPGRRMYATGVTAMCGPDGVITVIAEQPPDTTALTPIGDVDRAAPREPASDGSVLRAPRDEREARLCRLVAEVLGLAETGPDDDFFELGGQSLTAIRLAGRMKTEFGVDISLRTVFERRTVAALAEVVALATTAVPRLAPRERPTRMPLSLLQGGLWFMNRTEGASGMYNTGLALRLRGCLDRDAVAEALTDVIRRHESLRTVFPDDDGTPYQRILQPAGAGGALSTVDVDEPGLDAAVTAAASTGFDLSTELPIRGHLLCVSPTDHVLLLILHHIAGDGWSLAPLARDFATAYAARTEGRSPAFPPLELQYADYALWQREVLGDERDANSPLGRQLTYWRDALAGIPDELPLPTDFPRQVDRDYTGGTVRFEIDPGTHRALAQLALDHRASMFMVLRGVVATLLTRLGAGTDIPLGMAVTGRTEDALDDVIGCFINTLVFRTDTGGSPGFGELLDRIRESDLGAYANRDVPFHRLVEALNPERSLGRNPLFQVMLDVQQATTETVSLPGLAAEPYQIDPRSAKVDLLFGFEEDPEQGIRCRLEYSLDLFEPATAEAMARRFLRVLKAVVVEPDQPIDRIDVLEPGERERWVRDFNDTARPRPATLVTETFEAQAARRPGAPAVEADGVGISYGELNERANHLAHLLIAEGVGPERLVALALPRSADLVVAVLAVLKAGGGYLPVDPEYPGERLTFMLSDARPVLVLTTRAFTDSLPDAGVRTLVVDEPDVREAIAGCPAGNPSGVRRHESDIAYVIYTSGSTGRPKGVAVEHRSLAQYLDYAKESYESLAGQALLHGPVSFDMAVTTLYGPLINGGRIVVAEIDEPGPEPGFSKVTPSHLPLLTLEQGSVSPSRELVVGGEQLLGESLTEWRRRHPDAAVINEYGPTEATVGCAAYRLDPGQATPTGAVPVGRPTFNTQLYVLDSALRPVPPGVAGELYIGGAQLARGYLRRPGLTATRFVADPFGGPGGRLYRTGDLARHNRTGDLEYLGRIDEQVKLRGFRIELGEVESVLASAPGVVAAVAVVREDQPGVRGLVGYVVPALDDVTAVRDWVAERLPDYMVPSTIVSLESLPLSAGGKLDRKALPRPERARATGPEASGGPEETLLRGLFGDLLGVTEVGLTDSFFEMGGDSIVSIQLVARARQAGLDLMPKDIFAHKTVERLAQLAAGRANKDTGSAEPVDDVATGEVEPTPIVRWWRDLGGPLDGIHQAVLVAVPASLRQTDLTGAVQALLDHHDALRMRLDLPFTLTIDPVGTVGAEAVVRRVDLTGLGEQASDEAIRRHADAARERLSARDGVMLQFVWFDTGCPDRPGRLLIMAHHLVVDGVSWRILLPDLRAAVEAVRAGREPELPEVGTSLRRWSSVLRTAAEAGRAELPYWLDVLRPGATPLAGKPLDRTRDVAATARSHTHVLPADRTESLLTTVAKAYHVRVDDILLTALAVAVGSRLDRPDLLVDLEGHGREDIAEDIAEGVDVSRTVGWFTTMYPVRLTPGPVDFDEFAAGGPIVGTVLRLLKEQLRSVPRNGLGFGLLRYLDPVAGPRLSALDSPQVLVNYLGRFGSPAGAEPEWAPLAGAPPLGAPASPGTPLSHALELDVLVREDAGGPRLTATWTWPAALFSDEEVRRLAERWSRALEGIARHAERPEAGGYTPSDLPLVSLSQEDIDSLEAEWRTLQ
nr:non-ribosomal peptide synthetase [Saccharothrix sp. NRRL B-16314]